MKLLLDSAIQRIFFIFSMIILASGCASDPSSMMRPELPENNNYIQSLAKKYQNTDDVLTYYETGIWPERKLSPNPKSGKGLKNDSTNYELLNQQDIQEARSYKLSLKKKVDKKIELDRLQQEQKSRRREIASEIAYVINDAYAKYEIRWYSSEAGISTATDFATLGLSAAAATVGGESLKGLLAAVATGVGGASLSIKKNVLQSQTMMVLIKRMRDDRDEIWMDLCNKLDKKSLDEYGLFELLVDIQKYYQAGTVLGALQSINNRDAQGLENANKQIRKQLESIQTKLLEKAESELIPKKNTNENGG